MSLLLRSAAGWTARPPPHWVVCRPVHTARLTQRPGQRHPSVPANLLHLLSLLLAHSLPLLLQFYVRNSFYFSIVVVDVVVVIAVAFFRVIRWRVVPRLFVTVS